MKFQIPNMHHSEVNGRTHTQTDRQTDRQTDKPKAICPSNFFKVGGITNEPFMRKPTMWFPNRSDTNRAVQAQKTRWLEA